MSTDLESLKIAENIIAASYLENFKFTEELAKCFGGSDSRVRKMRDSVNKIQTEWHKLQLEIKEIENENLQRFN